MWGRPLSGAKGEKDKEGAGAMQNKSTCESDSCAFQLIQDDFGVRAEKVKTSVAWDCLDRH